MPIGLIITMGFSPEPLIYTISEHKADFVVFIGTNESLKKSVDETVEGSGLRPSQYHKIEVKDSPEEVGVICEKFQIAKDWLEKQGADQIIADPTGARKWMSAGAVMAASFLGIPMMYVDAKYQNNTVIKESMKIVALGNAYDQTGFIVAAKGKDAYNNFDFGGATSHFSKITPTHAHKKELFEGLAMVCMQLARWDRFEHYHTSISPTLNIAIEQVDRALRSFSDSEAFAAFTDELKIFSGHLNKIEASKSLQIDFIVDLYLNADRCISRNRFDDAVARHYRTLEAISQFLLISKGINPSNPNYSGLSNEQKTLFLTAVRGGVHGENSLPEKIDLKLGFWLLKSIGHPVKSLVFKGIEEYKSFVFERILNDRNNSILAHGFEPIGKDRAEKFHHQLQELLEKVFETDYLQVRDKLTLPKMPEIGF